jgi:SagB-type dehydrogenase family enzyme
MPIGYIKGNAAAQDAPQTAAGLSLPPPQTDGGVSVERALHKRRSQRQYQETAISANQLSQILWAAYGMTAPGRRTSPSAGALYALEIYVVVGDVVGIAPGVYKYIPEEHQLELIVAGDVRNEYLGYAAPATLLYCADFEKALESYGEQDLKYVYMEAGHSAQNVYLQAESLGLCTCAVGGFIEGYLREIFKLPANEGPLYLMPIGYAKNFALDPPFVYEAKDLPPRVSFDVYLCIGQSNMAGDDAILEEQDKHVIPNTLLFNGENWESAQPWYYKNIETRGLNRYNNVDTEFIGNGSFINPAFYFAHHMQAAAPGRTIGIISNARSWSSIDEWRKGEFCYNQTVLMTKAALQQGGILRGILWHQGESDLWLDILPPYLSKLNQVVDDLRSEFGLLPENCPFIAGEIGYAFGAGLGFLPPSAFNDLLPGFVNAARNTDYVSAALDPAYPANGGLPMFNEFHFNTASQRVLGMRYAEKMLKMQGGGLPSGLTVSGLVKSYNPQHPVNLKLQGENIFYTHTIYKEESGSGLREQPFAFEGVEPGTYTLLITKDAHTSFTVRNIVVADKDVDLTQDARPEVRLMTLRCGDINGDGNINNSDLTILWQQANYNRSASAAANKLCDLNGDGLINNIDLTILWLGYNYNRGEIEIK